MRVVLFRSGADPVLKLPVTAAQYIVRNLPQSLGSNRVLYDKIMKAIRSSDGVTADLSDVVEANSMEFRSNPVFADAVEKFDCNSKFIVVESPCEWFTIDNFFTNDEKLSIPDLENFTRCSRMVQAESPSVNYGW